MLDDAIKKAISAGEGSAWLSGKSRKLRLACTALSSDELAEWIRAEPPSRKALAICPEFVCYEEPDGSRTVEATPELNRAMAIARFRLSGAKGVDIRLAQARALFDLAEFAAGHDKDRDTLLAQLASAFGKPALAFLNTPPVTMPISPQRRDALARRRRDGDPPVASHSHSPEEQRKKAECAADSLTAAMKSAARAIVEWKFPARDKRSTQPDGVDLVWLMHPTAKDIFRQTLERPAQQLIRAAMEDDGYGFSGNDVEQRWADLFAAAGLDRLPRT